MALCTSSGFSPKPSMIPVLVRLPYSLVSLICSRERWYLACGLTLLYRLSTVSILWETTSWPALIILYKASQEDLTSGISVSMVVLGDNFFVSVTVWYHISAPLSLSSSLFTDVITACFTRMSRMASATLLGSSTSYSGGLPVATAQNE